MSEKIRFNSLEVLAIALAALAFVLIPEHMTAAAILFVAAVIIVILERWLTDVST